MRSPEVINLASTNNEKNEKKIIDATMRNVKIISR